LDDDAVTGDDVGVTRAAPLGPPRVAVPYSSHLPEKGNPIARWARKVTGLTETAELPKAARGPLEKTPWFEFLVYFLYALPRRSGWG
jgi:hypothetical protein